MKPKYPAALVASAAVVMLLALLEWRSALAPSSVRTDTVTSAVSPSVQPAAVTAAASPGPPGAATAARESAAPSQAGAGAAQGEAPPAGAPPAAASASVAPPIAAPDSAPVIVSVSLTPTVVQAGQTVSGTVITSSNVASVEARIGGYAASLTKTGVGEFHLTYPVPNLPPLLRRRYAVEVTARNTRGDRASTQTSITVR